MFMTARIDGACCKFQYSQISRILKLVSTWKNVEPRHMDIIWNPGENFLIDSNRGFIKAGLRIGSSYFILILAHENTNPRIYCNK